LFIFNSAILILFLGIVMISSTVAFSSSEAILPENLPDVSQASSHVRIIEGENIVAYARPLYTSLDDPSNHVVSNAPYDGVARLILTRTDGTFGCSGTLANDHLHVFTAAHCVSDNNGNYVLKSGSATFEGLSQSITIAIDADPSKSKNHPDYNGDYIKGNDIAILKLVSAPSGVPGIQHATSGSEVANVVYKKGYGLSGFFSSGTDSSNYPFGTKRVGQNIYDDFADTMYNALGYTAGINYIPGAIYQYDSDDGTSSHDAFGFFFGKSETGLSNNEILSAPGDSGGPTFDADGKLIGITSYGITLQYTNHQTSDCTKTFGGPRLDSSCGEFAADTRVSQYSSFIDSVLTSVPDTNPPVISAINVDTLSNSATINWTTDEPATSVVNYGLDNSYGTSVSDSTLVTSHTIHLFNLSPLTTYHFQLTSVDDFSNSASSSDLTFKTNGLTNTVSVNSITYSASGGKTNDRNLTISVHLIDNQNNNVSGASVSILLQNGNSSWSGTKTTDSNGNANFSLKNAPSGTYTTTITSVVANGLTWDGVTPNNTFTK